MHELGHRERQVLLSLDHHLRGIATTSPPLPYDDYARAVLALRVLGLAGADYRVVRDDWEKPPVHLIERVWLTIEGRELVRAL